MYISKTQQHQSFTPDTHIHTQWEQTNNKLINTSKTQPIHIYIYTNDDDTNDDDTNNRLKNNSLDKHDWDITA